MKIKISKITIIIVSVLMLICGVFIVTIFFSQDQIQKEEDLTSENEELIAEPAELDLKMHYVENIKLYIYDTDSGEKEDITDQAEWAINDASIAFIGNESVKGQVIAKDKEGETEVIVSYNNKTVKIPVKVVRPKLEVECFPRTEDRKFIAKVGEKIVWVSIYLEPGSPNYTYEWSGTDGLEGKGAISEEIIYTTPGLKRATIFTVDTAGSTAEGECEIEIVE